MRQACSGKGLSKPILVGAKGVTAGVVLLVHGLGNERDGVLAAAPSLPCLPASVPLFLPPFLTLAALSCACEGACTA